MSTTKLYLEDSLRLEFSATLVAQARFQNSASLVLDQTAFYPEGGGQLADRGVLSWPNGQVHIIDVQIDEDGRIHHLCEAIPDQIPMGLTMKGRVEEARRRDFMSQHTGQHLLSSACARWLDAETVSARLGSESSTIDLALQEISEERLQQVEDRVNQLILENRPVRPLFPSEEELATWSLRRMPKVTENVRLIEIQDFDMTPCGGTHCNYTGQVGLIRVTGKERYKGMMRIHFKAGMRAINHLNQQDRLVRSLSKNMGCAAGDLLETYQRLQSEIKQGNQQLGKVRAEWLNLFSERLLNEARITQAGNRFCLIAREPMDHRSGRGLAAVLCKTEKMLVLIAVRERAEEDWRVVIARGNQVEFDCGAWFRGAGKIFGARGGGKPDRAEGRMPGDTDWSQIVLEALA